MTFTFYWSPPLLHSPHSTVFNRHLYIPLPYSSVNASDIYILLVPSPLPLSPQHSVEASPIHSPPIQQCQCMTFTFYWSPPLLHSPHSTVFNRHLYIPLPYSSVNASDIYILLVPSPLPLSPQHSVEASPIHSPPIQQY